MAKLFKNWIFTLVITALLITFGFLMLFVPDKIMNFLVFGALIIYIILVLCYNVIHYRGIMRIIALFEALVVTAMTFCMMLDALDFLPVSGINATIGFLLWLRSFVEILHGYLQRTLSEPTQEFSKHTWRMKNITIFKLIIYILLLSLGAILITTPLISERAIEIIVAILSFLASIVFGCITYSNYYVTSIIKKKKASESPIIIIEEQKDIKENVTEDAGTKSTAKIEKEEKKIDTDDKDVPLLDAANSVEPVKSKNEK